MKTNYTEQAKKFLEETQTTCKIEFSHKGIAENWGDDKLRNIYNITLSNARHNYKFKFYDSISNTEKRNILQDKKTGYSEFIKAKSEAAKNNNFVPTEYDILACLTKYDCGTFENFCSEFGYDTDSRKAERIYFDVQKEYDNIKRLFTNEQLELLQEIN